MAEEQKKEKTFQDLQAEYSQLCTRAGHIQYQLFALEKDLEMVNEALRAINVEAASKAPQAAPAAAPAADAAPVSEEKKDEKTS